MKHVSFLPYITRIIRVIYASFRVCSRQTPGQDQYPIPESGWFFEYKEDLYRLNREKIFDAAYVSTLFLYDPCVVLLSFFTEEIESATRYALMY